MSSKENYCYKILNTYGLIVDFEGEQHRSNVPSPVKGESFSEWKLRVLGDEVTNVVVYAPYAPRGNKKIQTLQAEASAEHLEKTFKLLKKNFAKQKAIAKEETALAFASVPKDTLQDLVDEFYESLEPSVQEFFQNCLASMETDIDTETLIRELLVRYNAAVKRCRELEGKKEN